jgi:flagellar hook protein FlgE
MSFQQGLSGLNVTSKSLEVIGNNVANASTVGFKQSKAIFSDVYANSLNGSGASPIGIGVNLTAVVQQFTQGNITGTNNPLDVAINGNGFFRMSDSGTQTYTRNGQFQLDKNGYITDPTGKLRLTGQVFDINTGNPDGPDNAEIQLDFSDIAPNASTEVETKVNLDSRKTALTAAGFDPDDPTTYHNSTAITVYDSLGNDHTMQTYYVKTAANVWDVFVTMNGATTHVAPATSNGQLTFPAAGTGINPTSTVGAIPYTPTTGAAAMSVTLDLTNSTQFGSTFSVNTNVQNGYTSGNLASFDIADDGIILGRYTNGESRELGQVRIVTFKNMNGLKPLGGNNWGETSESGEPIPGVPGTGQLGVLQSSATEDSNVDLTSELVNMITAQRVYQANAQTIKTQDQVLQTLVNLR